MSLARPWTDDKEFCEYAAAAWPVEWRRILLNKSYDKGATQKLTYRWQGWCAAKGKQP